MRPTICLHPTLAPCLQWGDLNPALLFGSPVTLRADETFVTIMTEAAGMQDVTSSQILACITDHLSSEDEVLLAASTTDLESGQPGLFKLFYVLLPSDDGALVAKRQGRIGSCPHGYSVAAHTQVCLAGWRPPRSLRSRACGRRPGRSLSQMRPSGKLSALRSGSFLWANWIPSASPQPVTRPSRCWSATASRRRKPSHGPEGRGSNR